jgi:hypothetical protein
MSVAESLYSAWYSVWWEKVKEFWTTFDLKKWSEQIGGSSSEAIEAAVYFCLSFGIGFLFKKYFKFLFFSLICAVIMIKVLEYNHFLTIDWTAIKDFLGIGGSVDANQLINRSFDWVKAHILLFIAVTVGFLVGYKLG